MATTNPSVKIAPIILGERRDLEQAAVPDGAAYKCENIITRQGKMKVRPGYIILGSSVTERIMALAYVQLGSSQHELVMGTVDGWWRWSGSAWVDLTDSGDPLTGSETNWINFRVFNKAGTDYLLSTNGADSLKKWDGTAANYSAASGSPPTAKCMGVIFDRLILGHLMTGAYAGHNAFDVSANKDFESGWGGSVLAGYLADTPGEIVEIRELGQYSGVIYKSDAIYSVIPQPGLVPFNMPIKQANIIGPVSPKAVVSLPLYHVYLAHDGSVQVYDGNAIQEYNRVARVHIENTADIDRLNRSFGFYDSQRNEVWFIYPGVGSNDPNRGIVIDANTGTIWPVRWDTLRPTAALQAIIQAGITIGDLADTLIGDMAWTFGDFIRNSIETVMGDKDGQAYQESGYDDNGTAIPAYWETGLMQMGSPMQLVTVKEVEHAFEPAMASQSVTTKIKASNYGEEPTEAESETNDIYSDIPAVAGFRSTARNFALRVEMDAAVEVHWRGGVAAGVARGVR